MVPRNNKPLISERLALQAACMALEKLEPELKHALLHIIKEHYEKITDEGLKAKITFASGHRFKCEWEASIHVVPSGAPAGQLQWKGVSVEMKNLSDRKVLFFYSFRREAFIPLLELSSVADLEKVD